MMRSRMRKMRIVVSAFVMPVTVKVDQKTPEAVNPRAAEIFSRDELSDMGDR